MSFWSRGGRDKESEEAPAPTAPSATSLSVVEFWAADRRTVAAVDLSRERLTDLVNREDYVSVVVLDAAPEDPSQPIQIRPGQEWSHLKLADALLILPPPQPTNPLRRLHRPRQPVEILTGRFVVSGMVHVPPGGQAAAFLFRQGARFAPVTRAAVRGGGVAGFEQRADVVLVNMRYVETIRDAGLEEGEALVPPEAGAPSF